MKILLDLQAVQSPDSRMRGIGRYSRSLTQALIPQALARGHEVHGILNHAFPDTLGLVKEEFAGLLPAACFHVFEIPMPVSESDPQNVWRTKAAEKVREEFLQALQPDITHVGSLFEGFAHDCVTSCPEDARYPTAVTLYDLIPFLKQEQYLTDPRLHQWYMRKIESLRRADLLLAISDYSRLEALEALKLPPRKVVSISGDADAHFTPGIVTTDDEQTLRARLGLERPLVMYTGGIDYRKNIEGLIEAYATLPQPLRQTHQLAIVCNARPEDKFRLLRLAKRAGLAADEVVLTGYVSDDDLVTLYRLCKLFVFPSLHEGFGLPVLEAMRCGAPVIGANVTSIPEILGMKGALFDPASPTSIRAKMEEALTSDDFRRQLTAHGARQEKLFSWAESGRRALDAFEELHDRRKGAAKAVVFPATARKPRLAYVSPLPPERTGIADYSADLLPELARYYEIDLVSDLPDIRSPWLKENLRQVSVAQFDSDARGYDRILYHIGNSPFHTHMLGLLSRHPGTVVLHDFYLSGLLNYLETTGERPLLFQQSLYRSHGYAALRAFAKRGPVATLWEYPCNVDVLERAQGIIVHSGYSLQLAHEFYNVEAADVWARIPLLRKIPASVDKAEARRRLGIGADTFVVCSFGILDQTKLNHVLIEAWLQSSLASSENRLIFVGSCPDEDYTRTLQTMLRQAEHTGQVTITGFADDTAYHDYLAAADIGVQLRGRSRGETSAAMADCLVYGLPLIVNAHGSAAEILDELAVKLPDNFTMPELKETLERLFADGGMRHSLSERSMDYTRAAIAPVPVAKRYFEAIESFAATHPVARRRVLFEKISALAATAGADDADLTDIARSIAENAPSPLMRQVFIDVTGVADIVSPKILRQFFEQQLTAAGERTRIEPIYWDGTNYRYARALTLDLLGFSTLGLPDAVVAIYDGDSYCGNLPAQGSAAYLWLQHHVQRGLKIMETEIPILSSSASPKSA